MRKGDFGLKVLACDELDNGLVLVKHMQQYKLRLSNFNATLSCDASVEIDGRFVGRFRIKPYSSISIERPTNDTGKFTFYRHGTSEAKIAGLVGREIEGIISVTYHQEKPEEVIFLFIEHELRRNESGDEMSGGTGLSGISSDRYEQADKININPHSEVTIQTRLICHDEPRPLI